MSAGLGALHRPHRTGAIGRKVWEMVPDTHATEVFHTGKPVFAKAVNANGPAFTSYFPRFDRMGSCAGCFSMSSSRVWRTLRT